MNLFYAKVALYAYPNLEDVIEQIDELVERKAISSMNNFMPCINQCNKIISLTNEKDILINLKLTIDKILLNFDKEEMDILDYKYFKKKNKEYFLNKDTTSRQYFRRQIAVAKKFALKLEKKGYTDERFQNECFKVEFLKELLKRVVEHEKLSRKNLTLKEKQNIMKNKKIIVNKNANIA